MTSPHLRLTEQPHDRAGERRHDEEWLAERWGDDSARVLVIAGTRVRPVDGRVEWHHAADAPDGIRLFLGHDGDGSARFAVIVDRHQAPGTPEEWHDLRTVLLQGDDPLPDAPLLLHAIGLAEWLYVTRFCSRCGADLTPRAAGHELVCEGCGRVHFPRTDPAVIMLVTDGEPGSAEERCLLGHQAVWAEGRFSTLAGFCEPGESLEDAVRREVAEEVGVRVGDVRYFGNQPWPFPGSLMLGFRARALTTDIVIDQHEIADARWFTRAELLAAAESGAISLPGAVSIARSLIEDWYGASLPGGWELVTRSAGSGPDPAS